MEQAEEMRVMSASPASQVSRRSSRVARLLMAASALTMTGALGWGAVQLWDGIAFDYRNADGAKPMFINVDGQ